MGTWLENCYKFIHHEEAKQRNIPLEHKGTRVKNKLSQILSPKNPELTLRAGIIYTTCSGT